MMSPVYLPATKHAGLLIFASASSRRSIGSYDAKVRSKSSGTGRNWHPQTRHLHQPSKAYLTKQLSSSPLLPPATSIQSAGVIWSASTSLRDSVILRKSVPLNDAYGSS